MCYFRDTMFSSSEGSAVDLWEKALATWTCDEGPAMLGDSCGNASEIDPSGCDPCGESW